MKTTVLAGTLYEEFDERLGVYVLQNGKEVELRFATVRAIGPAPKSGKVNQRKSMDREKLCMAKTQAQ